MRLRTEIRARRYVLGAALVTALAATCGTATRLGEDRPPAARAEARDQNVQGPSAVRQRSRTRAATTGSLMPRFAEVTGDVLGARPPTPTWGSVFLDHNRDGLPDLLVDRHKRRAWFYENSATGLRRSNGASFQPHDGRGYFDRHGCAWGEANGDGRPDLLCVAGAQDGRGSGGNQLLVQTGDGKLRERTAAFKLGYPRARGRSVNWLDHDRDGDLDLFIGNEIRSGHPNLLLRNTRGRFRSIRSPVAREMATVNSTWAD